MSIWDTLFGRPSGTSSNSQPDYSFGRYTDAYKTVENYAAWDETLASFDDGDYLGSFTHFMEYLKDEEEQNVVWKREGDTLYFELYQGSKRVTGFADTRQVRASARIAQLEALDTDLLQRLTSLNYELKYSRFALDENDCLTIIFDTPVHDASPHKLYHALKEMALRADKQDDLLLEEFSDILSPVEITHLRELDEGTKRIKRDFMTGHIRDIIGYLSANRINPEEHPGAVAYLLLDLVYRLDYLLIPEGYTMDALERMHRMYFSRETDQPASYKNVRLLAELQQLLERAPESFAEELYAGRSTFGITLPASHDRLVNLIDNELVNMDWYQDHDYPEIARAVPGYIVGYSQFNYALPPPDRELLKLFYRIGENDYFCQLGFQQSLRDATGRPARRPIRSAIGEIAKKFAKQYPRFRPSASGLNFDNMIDFSRSYLMMMRDLDLGQR